VELLSASKVLSFPVCNMGIKILGSLVVFGGVNGDSAGKEAGVVFSRALKGFESHLCHSLAVWT
jgi:hypothetical protein